MTATNPLNDWIQVLAGLAALAGHIWPVWLGFKGKAVATGLGLFLGLAWPVGLGCFGVFLTVFSLSRIVSLASVVAAISLPLLMAACSAAQPTCWWRWLQWCWCSGATAATFSD